MTPPPLRDGTVPSPGDDLRGPDLVAMGSLVVAMNEVGLALTTAIGDAGHEHLGSNSDLVVLATLRLDGPQRPSALAKRTGLTSGGMTNLLDRLERAELVHRSAEGVDDARGVLVAITRQGTDVIAEIAGIVADRLTASPEHFAELRDRFEVLGRTVRAFPSSLTDVTGQLRDVVLLSELGRRATDVLQHVLDDPTPAKSTLTLWLAHQPDGARPGQISRTTNLSSAGVSELLDRLERRSLIVRTAGRPPDRRVVTIECTQEGTSLLQRALRALYQQRDFLVELIAAD